MCGYLRRSRSTYGIKGDVMDIGVLRTTIMETGQWVDGDLYNGRIVLIANSYVFKSLYLIIQEIFYGMK
jgi:small-conductance mechanosensitive channel